ADAIFDTVSVDIAASVPNDATACLFRAGGRTVKSPGYLKVYEEPEEKDTSAKEEGQKLPQLKDKDPLNLLDVLSEAHTSEPPPRFNEASLIKMLERHGIGRPSTYAPILQTIIGRGYVREESRRLHPSDLGIHVTDLLIKHF